MTLSWDGVVSSWIVVRKLQMNHTKDNWVWSTVQILIKENGRITVSEIERYFWDVAYIPLSHGIVVEINQIHLGMRKICARWVLKLLDDKHKWNWVVAGLDFISHYHTKVEDLFYQIVTGDEKWVYNFTSKMKIASQQWLVKGEDQPVKAKQERLTSKIYPMMSRDNQGILFGGICRKRCQNDEGDLFRHTFAPLGGNQKEMSCWSHKVWSCCMITDLTTVNSSRFFSHLEIFRHLVYSPNLTPSDYYLFANLHRWLGWRQFS